MITNRNYLPYRKNCEGYLLYKNKFILAQKSPHGYTIFPGGGINKNETQEEALRRETKEETGLNIKNLKFLSYENEFMPELKNHSLVLMFQGTPEGKESNNDEVSEQKWFTKEEALKLDLAFNHKDILIKYFNKTK